VVLRVQRTGGDLCDLRQESQGWGSRVINRLANDLRASFPDMKGLSARNLQYMTTMVRFWGADQNAPQVVAHLPWGHVRTILDKAALPRSGTGMPPRLSNTGDPATSC
jgi:hypothetical protein